MRSRVNPISGKLLRGKMEQKQDTVTLQQQYSGCLDDSCSDAHQFYDLPVYAFTFYDLCISSQKPADMPAL